MTGHRGGERSKHEQVEFLLRKTVENGATPDEEVSAVQLAHMIVRQHGLDMDAFKAALGKIGKPPRYHITGDGFLVPAEPRAGASAAPGDAAAGPPDICPVSPTRRHRMEKFMQGTLATGQLYCVHCGLKRDAAAGA